MAKHLTLRTGYQGPGPNDTLRQRVAKRDRYECTFCGASEVNMDVDHLTPRTWFPTTAKPETVNAHANLVLSCSVCNKSKGTLDVRGFAAMLRMRGVSARAIAAMVRRVRSASRRALPTL